MKILLIEDNKEVSLNIKKYLELDWYSVDCFYDWVSWFDNALIKKYDLILLDLMLPWIDGLTISKKLNWKKSTPIIIITAKEDIETKLKWFEHWVVDYIIKPFDLRELEARIKIVTNSRKNLNLFWNLFLDFENRIFKKDNIEISLWKTEFEILHLLYENKNRYVSRSEIIENIWWENALFESDSKLDVYISNIRSKFLKEILKTSKWYGYKFNLDF